MKRSALLTLFSVLASFAVAGCDTGSVVTDCNDLGSDGPARKAAALVDAVNELSAQADLLATDLLTVCTDIANELGITPPDPTGDETPREAVCNAVAAEISTIITEAEAAVTVVVEPAVCEFSVEGYASCVAECDVDVNADVEVNCMGGELRGMCTGTCSGSCTVEGSASCTGTCSATCTGTCSGSCTGQCDGTCSAVDDEGNCVGTCDGTCMGSCSGTCMGDCNGSCTADIEGSCEGECRGSCDVEFVEPRCDGNAMVDASAECQAACDAELTAMATCSEPRVTVEFAGTAAAGRVADLQRALQLHWPRFVALRARIEAGAAAGSRVYDTASDLGDATVGLAVCIASTATAALDAVASFEVSVTVSVSVSGSVTAG